MLACSCVCVLMCACKRVRMCTTPFHESVSCVSGGAWVNIIYFIRALMRTHANKYSRIINNNQMRFKSQTHTLERVLGIGFVGREHVRIINHARKWITHGSQMSTRFLSFVCYVVSFVCVCVCLKRRGDGLSEHMWALPYVRVCT